MLKFLEEKNSESIDIYLQTRKCGKSQSISNKAKWDFSFNGGTDGGTKMLEMNSNILVISIHVNVWNPPVKRQKIR